MQLAILNAQDNRQFETRKKGKRSLHEKKKKKVTRASSEERPAGCIQHRSTRLLSFLSKGR